MTGLAVPPMLLAELCGSLRCRWRWPRPRLVLEWVVGYDAAHLSLMPSPPMPTQAGLVRCAYCGRSRMIHGPRLVDLAEAT